MYDFKKTYPLKAIQFKIINYLLIKFTKFHKGVDVHLRG